MSAKYIVYEVSWLLIIMKIELFYSMHLVPTLSVKIEDSGISQVPGKSYNLTCNVHGPENFNPTFKYQWIKNNGTLTQIRINSSTLIFHSLRLSDIGWYTCNIDVNLTYLSGPNNHTVSSTAFEIQFSGIY